jgi:hypothetical protein
MSTDQIISRRKFPPKQIEIRGKAVTFSRIETNFERSGIYVQHPYESGVSFRKYPSIYSVKLSGGFIYLWDVLAEEYYENLQLINYRQLALYNYLGSLRNRGYRVSLKGNGKKGDEEIKGLAQLTDTWWPTLVKDLDRLEDVMLIHRIRRPDFRGMPSEIVIHSPLDPQDLRDPQTKQLREWAQILQQRVKEEPTRQRRQGTMRSGTTDDGRNFVFQDRKQEDERFVFDFRQIVKAFGDFAERFALFAMEYFSKNWHLLTANKSGFEHDYRKSLELEMNVWGIHDNSRRESCYIAANKFRTIYCPMEEELCNA